MGDTPDPEAAAKIRFTVLRGGVGALLEGRPVALGGSRQRRLLAALLAEQGAVVSADRLADTIWPDGTAPVGARRTVMTYVSRLRTSIGGDHVVTNQQGYQLVLNDASYDAADFEAQLAVARAVDGVEAIAAYDAALRLWTGRAFGDDGVEWWLRPVAARLEELRMVALEEHIGRMIEIGRHAEAVADLEGLIVEQPLREAFVALEMRALFLGGRQAEALRAYRRFCEHLADETGLGPSHTLIDLEHRIVIGDSSLSPTAMPAGPDYELGELIGEGPLGAVYRAVQPSVGREVAVKAIKASFADDPRFVERFEIEARLVARLEHPHVVPLYDFWRRPGAAFMVFRLLRGGSLADRVAAGGALPLPQVTRLVEEIGGALSAAHRVGIVHRDVRPANVLFDESGDSYLYLADFGIDAADVAADREATLRNSGALPYASPEQALDGIARPASDQYSLAVVAWETLTGRLPFTGATPNEIRRTKLLEPLPSLDALDGPSPAAVSARLSAVLRRASAPEMADRYEDVDRFVRAWRAACSRRTSR
jgi:DNA-binding SARP family transcriptional activator